MITQENTLVAQGSLQCAGFFLAGLVTIVVVVAAAATAAAEAAAAAPSRDVSFRRRKLFHFT